MASQTSYNDAGDTGQTASHKLQARDLPSKRLLGKGIASIGYETEWKGVKCARKDFIGVPSDVFEAEAAALVRLKRHENVVETLGWTVDKISCSLLVEYVEDNLSGVLQRRKKSPGGPASTESCTQLQEALNMMLQAARGMESLHEQGILHGDLKTDNILVSQMKDRDTLSVKVADFGLLQTKRKSIPFVSRQVRKLDMVQWKAPEYFKRLSSHPLEDNDEASSESDSDLHKESTSVSGLSNDRVLLQACDVYSFAVTCSQILTGRKPYPNLSWKKLGAKIVKDNRRPKLPASCPISLRNLLEQCWDEVPDNRPTFSIIRSKLEDLLTPAMINELFRVVDQESQEPGVVEKFYTAQPSPSWYHEVRTPTKFRTPSSSSTRRCRSRSRSRSRPRPRPRSSCRPKSRSMLWSRSKIDASRECWTEVDPAMSHIEASRECWTEVDPNVSKKKSSAIIQRMITTRGELAVSKTEGAISMEKLNDGAHAVANVGADPGTQEPEVAEKFVTAPDTSSAPVSWYHSTRIQRMMERRGEFSSDVEFEIESSESHWSELDPAVSEPEHSRKANREYFEVLRRRRYVREGGQLVAKQLESIDKDTTRSLFDRDWDGLVVGEKLAEGGQAEIYAASLRGYGEPLAVKVFKWGVFLELLEKQWPPALLKYYQCDGDGKSGPTPPELPDVLRGATLLKDERLLDRFCFVMPRHWGDLRELIDARMMESHNQKPPFPLNVVLSLMKQIAKGMKALHGQDPPIMHRDLKTRNVLVHGTRKEGPSLNNHGSYIVSVADFECSVGVVGVGFWRAPEIMQQLKDKVPMTKVVFTLACDVYSYGMVCYEIVTGHLPFEDFDYHMGSDIILNGQRPKLPLDLHPMVENLIKRCWHSNPLERPSFGDILICLNDT